MTKTKMVETDGNVYLVRGEDADTYGTYLTREQAKARQQEMDAKYPGGHFNIDVYRLGPTPY